MPIIYASDGSRQETRAYVSAWLDKKLQENPDYCIVDIGGARNPWYLRSKYVVDAYPARGREQDTIIGDLNSSDTWNKIYAISPDFIICTHLLEDVRNPSYIIDEMLRSCKSGYIAFPNKHQEMSRVESFFYVGYCHHRWIYTLCDQELKILAKFPIANYWASAFSLFRKLCSFRFAESVLKKIGFFPTVPDLPWLDPTKIASGNELGFLWQSDFEYSFINNDWAAQGSRAMPALYMDALREGL